MTKQDAKDGALRWMDEATINGHAVAAAEQADFRDRMDYLIGGVIAELGAQFPLIGTVNRESRGTVQMPADCKRVLRVVRTESGAPVDATVQAGVVTALPQGAITIIYERYPGRPTPGAPDAVQLDCAPEAEPLVPLKLAADVLLGTIDRMTTGAYLADRYHEMLRQLVASRGGAPIATVYAG